MVEQAASRVTRMEESVEESDVETMDTDEFCIADSEELGLLSVPSPCDDGNTNTGNTIASYTYRRKCMARPPHYFAMCISCRFREFFIRGRL